MLGHRDLVAGIANNLEEICDQLCIDDEEVLKMWELIRDRYQYISDRANEGHDREVAIKARQIASLVDEIMQVVRD